MDENPVKTSSVAPATRSTGGAIFVAAGILLSRVSGLVRQRVFAHYFGNSDASDAFYSALKIPNFLQNLFGEGVLSASFIPVYVGLRAQGREEEAGKLAGAIAALLGLVTSILVVGGILLTPALIDMVAPGFHGEKRELTLYLVQILFPGTGMVVMSAWCLGVLNSHRRFFLSYVAPVIWNVAIIVALVYGRRSIGSGAALPLGQSRLAIITAWGVVVGSFLQFAVQLPTALKLIRHFKLGLDHRADPVRKVARNFVPVALARGVVQVSAYVDNVLASYLPMGAVSSLAYAQSLYMLPISLFGMSISAVELSTMSGAQGTPEEIHLYLRKRLAAGSRKLAFLIIPSVTAFLVLGDVMISAVYQSGQFDRQSVLAVWAVLAGSSVGLLAGTLGRLYSSTFYSLHDTRTPLRFALVRVALTTGLGYWCGLIAPELLGINPSWGTAGLTASAGISGWVEFVLLRRALQRKIGKPEPMQGFIAKLWLAASSASAFGWLLKSLTHGLHPVFQALLVLIPYGLGYFALTWVLGIREVRSFMQRLAPLARRFRS